MKKEIAAAVLLAAILAGTLINVHYINRMSAELTLIAEDAASCARAGDWEGAQAAAGRLVDRWDGLDSYTHIIMHHSQIDSATDAMYSLFVSACSQDEGTAAEARSVQERIRSLASIERLRFGSIF